MEELRSVPAGQGSGRGRAVCPAPVAFRRLRIAQVSPLYERVPPLLYGGTERVVAYLCDALVRRGHHVTLFASGDSRTLAELCAPTNRALRLDPAVKDQLAPHVLELARVGERAHEFDVIHSHVDALALPFAQSWGVPTVHTLHGRLDLPYLRPLFHHFRDLPFVSISDSQREPLRGLNVSWLRTIHHGLGLDEYPIGRGRGGYLAFLGRLSEEKRPDLAIAAARRVGVPLKIAAKLDRSDASYFDEHVRPLLDGPMVEFVGEIGGADRARFLGDAAALLFPIDWPEPFGLVMIEALACGTPVVAFRRGSVPEIIRHGQTGYIVDTIEGMVEAVRRIDRIDRLACRQEVERRFTDVRMAMAYESAYSELLAHARR